MVRGRARSAKWKSSSHGKIVLELFEQARALEAQLAEKVILATASGAEGLELFAEDDSLEALNRDGLTPLEHFALAGDAPAVQLLTRAGAHVNTGGRRSVVELACESGSAETVSTLLQSGADLHSCAELADCYSFGTKQQLLPGWARAYPAILQPVSTLSDSAVSGWRVAGSSWDQGSVGWLMNYCQQHLALVPIGPDGRPDRSADLLFCAPLEVCTPELSGRGKLRVLNSSSGVVTEFDIPDEGCLDFYHALNTACEQCRRAVSRAIQQGPVRAVLASHLAARPALRALFTLPQFFGMRRQKSQSSSFETHKAQFDLWCEESGCGSLSPTEFTVSRFTLVEQTFVFLCECPIEQLQQSELLVTFEGEAAIDWGGVRKEFWLALLAALVDPELGLFVQSGSNAGYQMEPSPDPAQQRRLRAAFPRGVVVGTSWQDARSRGMWMVGVVLGKALIDRQLVGAHFVASLYKQLIGCELSFSDLESAEPDLHQSLTWLLEHAHEYDDLDDNVFAAPAGPSAEVPLLEGGENIAVTMDNVVQFVELRTRWELQGKVKDEREWLVRGLSQFIPSSVLARLEKPSVLELLLCGLDELNLEDWRQHTVYEGYKSGDQVIRWFWEELSRFSMEQRSLLLQFVTGTACLPLGGFSNLAGSTGGQTTMGQSPFKIVRAARDQVLPMAHTCFNQLDLPAYRTQAELSHGLNTAVTFGASGFGMV